MTKRKLVVALSGFASGAVLIAALFTNTIGASAQPALRSDVSDLTPTNTTLHYGGISAPVRAIKVKPGTSSKGQDDQDLLPMDPATKAAKTDPVVQSKVTTNLSFTAGKNFSGLGIGKYGFSVTSAPPDTNGAVGKYDYVQWVNTSVAMFSKSSAALLLGPVPGNIFWSGVGNPCETTNDGDPIVQYDQLANRWIFTQFANVGSSTGPYYECFAISTGTDPTGSYYRYWTIFSNLNDYPKLGVWPDAYYMSYNMFAAGTFAFQGSQVCALDRTRMLAGLSATQVCFQLSSSFGGLLPADIDGSIKPGAGTPEAFLNFGTNKLNRWLFHVNFTTPASSTLSGPTAIPVAAFTPPCGGTGGTCVVQPGTSTMLDTLGDRLMYRLAYRRFTDGHSAVVVNQSVSVNGGKVGIRWYEIRNIFGTPTVFQQGTYAPNDGNYRWMGSMAMDKVGNIALGYSISSTTTFPSIMATGRVPSDAHGTMESSVTMHAGGGSQTGGLHRWGDYSAMQIDPVDDCTFWYTTEYSPYIGSFNWRTQIVSFKMPACA